MNKFIVLRARNRCLFEKAVHRLSQDALTHLSYFPSRIRVRVFEKSLTILVNFEISDSGGFRKNYYWNSADSQFAFDGFPLMSGIDPQKNWAEQIQTLWTSDNELISTLNGTWSVVFVSEQRVKALSDFTGMTPLFYLSNDEYIAVSPRQSLIACACGIRKWNLDALSWLSAQSNLIGDDGSFAGVKHLPPQYTLEFGRKNNPLGLTITPREVWSSDKSPILKDSEIDELLHRLIKQAETIGRVAPGDLNVDITGGLDSRLVAALGVNSQLKEMIGSLSTSGEPQAHEVQAGRVVADHLGMQHKLKARGPASLISFDRIIENVKRSVYRYDASICPTDGGVGTRQKSSLTLTGSGGEVYRRHCKSHMKVTLRTEDEMLDLFRDYHQPTDPLSLEHPDLRAHHRKSLQKLAKYYADSGANLNDITDIFFMRYRLPLWNGIMMNNIYGSVRLYPLLDRLGGTIAFRLPHEHRAGDRLHFHLLRRLDPELCKIPFLKNAWSSLVRDEAKSRFNMDLPNRPLKVKGPPTVKGINPMIGSLYSDHWDSALDFILQTKSPEFWSRFDRKRLKTLCGSKPQNLNGVVPGKQIYSLLSVSIALDDAGIPARDGVSHPPHLDGFEAEKMFG